ncbi:MAG: hypothetical protein WD267_01235 [Balneolales bacterium]
MKNTEKNPFISPVTRKEFDPAETLIKIQEVIKKKDISARLLPQMTIFEALIQSLIEDIDEGRLSGLNENLYNAITFVWVDLEEVIKDLEKENHKLFQLALHGTEKL